MCIEKRANRPIKCKKTSASLAAEASVVTDRSVGYYRTQGMQRRGACMKPELIYLVRRAISAAAFYSTYYPIVFRFRAEGYNPTATGQTVRKGLSGFCA